MCVCVCKVACRKSRLEPTSRDVRDVVAIERKADVTRTSDFVAFWTLSGSRGKSDTHIRVYDCPACYHEMRLTVWGANPVT
jgi:hypothetical protein